MFKRILVPMDLSDRHQPAIDAAAKLAAQGQSEVILLHVIELIPGIPMEEEKGFYDRLERLARAHLDRYGEGLTKRQVSWRPEVLLGPRLAEIVRYGAEIGCDLIVMTSPRPDPSHPMVGLGSLSHRVSLLSPCPVLLVK